MKSIRYTLVTDGTSDAVLRHPIEWLLRRHSGEDWAGVCADRTALHAKSQQLPDKLPAAMNLYPCDLLFVHRDAEREPRASRVAEIHAGLGRLLNPVPAVCVIPVRMTEAWFLHDERAIRQAADNPSGNDSLDLPARGRLESVPDPKAMLFDRLERASGLTGRRLERFKRDRFVRRRRVAELIDDFEPLCALPAFAALEADLRDVLEQRGWAS